MSRKSDIDRAIEQMTKDYDDMAVRHEAAARSLMSVQQGERQGLWLAIENLKAQPRRKKAEAV